MAKDKKTVQFYADWHETFKALDNETAGKLIKHMFSFVNDENPVSEDQLINLLFIPFKSTFERDLVKWKATVKERSKAGRASAEAKKKKAAENQPVKKQQNQQVLTSVDFVEQTPTKSTDRDRDKDKDRDKDRDRDREVKQVKKPKAEKALPVPSLEEFIKHAKERKSNVNPEDVRLKYFSWKDNDWSITRDNKTRPILNWRSTLTNTVKFLGVVAIKENNSNLADPLTQEEANRRRLEEKKASM